MLWHFDTDAEVALPVGESVIVGTLFKGSVFMKVAGLCADSLRWAIAENVPFRKVSGCFCSEQAWTEEQNRKILLDLHVTEPADEKKLRPQVFGVLEACLAELPCDASGAP